jgi:uncharacterized protein (TIGR01244 family)
MRPGSEESMMFRKVTDRVSVSPQITPDMVADIADGGFVAIVNNRPDDEEAGQPLGDTIRAAAEAAGLRYTAIPVTSAGFSHPQVAAMAQALSEADGPVLAYCRSGTRSCNLWALAAAQAGGDPSDLVTQGAGAGYNLEGIRPLLDQLSGKA